MARKNKPNGVEEVTEAEAKVEPIPEVRKYRFELISGVHDGPADEQGNRKRYTAGDILESVDDLREKFRNRFKLVEDNKPLPVIPPATLPPQKATEADKTVEKKTYRAVHRSGGRWDVVCEQDGVPLNEKWLKRAEAKELEGKMNGLEVL